MKTKLLFCALLVFFTASISAQKNVPLVGTWKLVGGKSIVNDTTNEYKDVNAIKIVTPTHFAVFGQGSEGTIQYTNAGTIKMDDKSYIEVIEYSSTKSLIGNSAAFTYILTGNKWHVKGNLDNITLEEDWERVK